MTNPTASGPAQTTGSLNTRSNMRSFDLSGCPVCLCSNGAFAFASVDLLHGVRGLFQYHRCPECGSYYQNPRPLDEDIHMCYPVDYFTHSDTAEPLASATTGLRELVRNLILPYAAPNRTSSTYTVRLLGALLRSIPPLRRRAMFGLVDDVGGPQRSDRCLELGPGRGDDMWRLTTIGWRVTGIDSDPAAATVAMERTGSEVRVESILTHSPTEQYGLVYGSHAIEHVPQLRETLACLYSYLEDSGRIVLVLPNPRSLSARLYGVCSVVWDPPRHLTLPTAPAFAALLRDIGYRKVRARTTSRLAAHYSAFARARRSGVTGLQVWKARIEPTDRLLHVAEALLVRLGFDVGEEIIVSGARGDG